ncbi:MAG: hypothetical protein WDN75_20710 [Bacteroidota bacterium]
MLQFDTHHWSQEITSFKSLTIQDVFFNFNNSVTPNPPVAVTITPASCNTPPTITPRVPQIIRGVAARQPEQALSQELPAILPCRLTPGIGSFTYTVVGSTPGTCPNTQTVNVTLDNPTVNFTQSNACQKQRHSYGYTRCWLYVQVV